MKTSKIVKIVSSIMMAIMLITIICNVALAVDFDPGKIDKKDVSGVENITNMGGQIISIVTIIGSVVSVVVLVVLGIKYMMGSAEEKAEYKKTLMPYFIGAVLIFAASAIAGMVFSFAKNISAS